MNLYKNTIISGNNTHIIGDDICINGEQIPRPPHRLKSSNVAVINNQVFINGYEWKNGQWKRTLRALWYSIF